MLAMASNPTYKPSVYVGRVDPKKLAPLVDAEVGEGAQLPGPEPRARRPVSARLDVQAGDRARRDAGHLLSPYQSIQCTPSAAYGLDELEFRTGTRTRTADDAAEALATVVRHVLLRRRQPLLRARRDRARYWTRMQDWAREVRLRPDPTGLDIGGEDAGLVPTPAWRKRDLHEGIDRAWNPGDSIQLAIGQKDVTVTPLQMARFYALLANGGKLVTPYLVSAVEQPARTAARRRSPRRRSGPTGPSPWTSTRRRSRSCATVSTRPRTTPTAPRRRLRQLPRPDRRQDRHGGEGRRRCPATPPITSRTRRGGAAGGRRRHPYGRKGPIVVCAVIENGGHGGTAAAPAALQVFEQWFGVKAGAHGRRGDATDGRTPPPPARLARAGRSTSLALRPRGSTGCCSSRRSARSSPTGSGRSPGSRASTSRATRATTSSARRSPSALGVVALVVALAVDPDRLPRGSARDLRRARSS